MVVLGPAGARAYEYMAELCDGIGPRVAGKAGEARVASRITQRFDALGYAPAERRFTYKDAGASRTSRNVIATKPGASAEQIVIGARHDSVGVGRGAFDKARYGKIWHSKKDTVAYIEQRFPGRVQAQMLTESEALAEFLTTYSLKKRRPAWTRSQGPEAGGGPAAAARRLSRCARTPPPADP